MFVWITGLGLLAKLSLGAGVVAAGLTGVGVAGAADILPGDVQAAFDDMVAVVVPFADDEVTDDEVADDEVADDEVADDEVADLEVAHDEGDAQDVGDETIRIEDEESGHAQEDLDRESGDDNQEIEVEEGDEVQTEQNVTVKVDSATETDSGSDFEVNVDSEADAR